MKKLKSKCDFRNGNAGFVIFVFKEFSKFYDLLQFFPNKNSGAIMNRFKY